MCNCVDDVQRYRTINVDADTYNTADCSCVYSRTKQTSTALYQNSSGRRIVSGIVLLAICACKVKPCVIISIIIVIIGVTMSTDEHNIVAYYNCSNHIIA